MRTLLLMAMAGAAYGQCAYTTGKIPQGTVAVFRNGAILRQGPDFTVKGQLITPIASVAGDKFSAVFSIQILLKLPDGTAYTSYRNWIETWECPGTPAASSTLQLLETCSGSGGTPPNAWDCTGLMRATIKLPDGSTVIITGVSGEASGSQVTWTPIK
jgi:hypothetical protein